MAPSDDLTDLVERLRTAGFRVDTRQYLTAHELLLAYAARGRPLDSVAALASHLGPIFCTLPEEQSRFATEIAAWRGGVGSSTPPADRVKTPPPFSFWRRWRWAVLAVAAAIAIALGAGLALYREYRPVTIDGVVMLDAGAGSSVPAANAKVVFRDAAVDVDDLGRFRLTTRRADGDGSLQVELDGYGPVVRNVDADTDSPIRVTLRPRRSGGSVLPAATLSLGTRQEIAIGAPERYTRSGGAPWPMVAAGTLTTAAAMFALLVFGDRRKRRLALKRLQALGDPEELTLSPRAPAAVQLADHEVRRIGSALRKPQQQSTVDLDAGASVDATLRAGGLFVPVYAARRAMPEYVALVQRRSGDDHWAAWVAEWLDRLSANGVHVARFTFVHDPRTCLEDDDKRQPHRLLDLVAHHHRATLFVFAETDVCFDPLSGALQGWIDTVHALPLRVLFTPERPFRWTRREWLLTGEGFIVLPAGEEGFKAYAGIAGEWRIERMFPAPYARSYPTVLSGETHRWIDRNAPPDAVVDTLIRQLRGYLGPDAFAWLCACAIYPQISWPLTLQLGTVAGVGGDRLSALPALARLPWMRHAFMPDWLRERLLAALSPEQDAALRGALESMLGELALAEPGRTASGAGGAASTAASHALAISRWVGPLDLLRAAPPASPLRDRVFVGFIAGETRDRLLFQVGPELIERFRGGGVATLPGTEARTARDEARTSSQPAPRTRVYVSYRRDDSGPYAGRLLGNLRSRAPRVEVMANVDALPAGASWIEATERALAAVDVVIVVIGPRWLRAPLAKGEPAAGAIPPLSEDFVITEIATAIRLGKRLLPVLVGGAAMPAAEALPADVASLVRWQAIELRDGRWGESVDSIIRSLEPRSPGASAQTRTSLRDAAQRSAAQGRVLAQALLARGRAWFALHPWKGAAVAGVAAAIVAFATLRALLPDARVDAAPASPFVAVSPDGQWIATRAPRGNTALIEASSRVISDIADYGARATAAAFSASPDLLAVGYDDGKVWQVGVRTKQAEAVLRSAQSTPVLDVGYASDGRLLVAGVESLTIWDPRTSEAADRPWPSRFVGNLKGVVIAPGGDRYALQAPNGDVEVVYVDGRPSRSVQCGTSAFPALSAQRDRLACAGFSSGALRVPGSGRGDLVSPLHPGAYEIVSIAFSGDGRFVAAGGSDGLLDLWDVESGRLVAEPLRAVDGPVEALAFDAAGERLAALGQGRLVIWPVTRTSPAVVPPNADDRVASTATAASRTRVAMPLLTGMTVDTARIALERQRFILLAPTRRASSAPRDTIIEQSPPARTMVAPLTSVSVVVSDGSLVRTPNLVGLDLETARKALADSGLVSSDTRTGLGASEYRVVAQAPAAGTEVTRGSAVTVRISSSKDASQTALRPPGALRTLPDDATQGPAQSAPARNPAVQAPNPEPSLKRRAAPAANEPASAPAAAN